MKNQKPSSYIEIRKAEQNNLKQIDVNIPLNQFTVICGPSGSGKSSLAFETLFAEGQRRYTETLSNYARQYIKEASKPLIKSIKNIPPPILLSQRNNIRSSRANVGTHSETLDHLHIIFSKIGVIQCPQHKVALQKHSSSKASLTLKNNFKKGYLLFPIEKPQKENKKLHQQLIQDGLTRIGVIKRNKLTIQHLSDIPKLPKSLFYVVVDRLEFKDEKRTSDSISQCYKNSLKYNAHFHFGRALVYDMEEKITFFNEHPSCPICCFAFPLPFTPSLFNFNSTLGACSHCKGFGNHLVIDEKKVVPDINLTLAQGALSIFATPAAALERRQLHSFCKTHKIDLHSPWKKISTRHKKMLWKGHSSYYGVEGFFNFLETRKYKMHVRIFMSRFKTAQICKECEGQRVREEALWVRVQNKTISDCTQMTLSEMEQWIQNLKLTGTQKTLIKEPLLRLQQKLSFINGIGLGYLHLNRPMRTLSGGELQRLNLSSQLGIGFSQILYILDEPTIGLHPYDSQKLLTMIKELQKQGNTLVVVEHDADVIESAQHIIEMGPGSGFQGGEIIYNNSKSKFLSQKTSPTALSLRASHSLPQKKPSLSQTFLHLKGCHLHNLKNIEVDIPLGRVSVCTGVSGSGKSSLVTHTLNKILQALLEKKQKISFKNYSLKKIEGYESLTKVNHIDQSPAEQHSRSLVVTYIGAYKLIRDLIASTHTSKEKGFRPGSYSLNIDGGRCSECRGLGYQEIEMIFMDPVRLTCETCKGLRFKSSLLEVKFRNKNIHEILQMTVRQALDFFMPYPKIYSSLSVLNKIGLEYLSLGQNLASLSGGESQRLKLARELNSGKMKDQLYIFDEPSTGLHFKEIDLLVKVFQELASGGATVLLVEHNLQVISQCDYIIDLGPFAGDQGGSVIGQGFIHKFVQNNKGVTCKCLQEFLKKPLKKSTIKL